MAGDRDLVVNFSGMNELIPNLSTGVPNLTRTVMLPGAGHWTRQERPDEVNAALLAFLAALSFGIGWTAASPSAPPVSIFGCAERLPGVTGA